MRTYVSTIGHYSPRVMRPILDNGLDADDVIVLLRPRGDTSDRAKSAIQDVDQTVNEPRSRIGCRRRGGELRGVPEPLC